MPISEPIRLVPYDPVWPAVYVAEAARIRRVAPVIENIEHFGSTAIPGLISKPTIDIMASVSGLTAAGDLATWLQEDGYEEMRGNFAFRRFFRKSASPVGPSFHLHLVEAAVWPDKSERLFRDWLLSHPPAVAEYAALKSHLASRFTEDREAYTDAKSDFIRAIVNQARASRRLPPLTVWEE
jgi:GrpB-like predicted nucleotidyltransferase (UPF0157 family)